MTDDSRILSAQAVQEQRQAGSDLMDGRVRLERFRAVLISHELLRHQLQDALVRKAELAEKLAIEAEKLAIEVEGVESFIRDALLRILESTGQQPPPGDGSPR